MLKLIHTADWHLGQTFYEFDRKKEHLHFLSELKKLISERKIDVLLVAGDVFDSPNPPADAQEMYYGFLCSVTSENPDLQIIIIAGNHDSAARLEAPNPLLNILNITVKGDVKRTVDGEIDYQNLIVPIKQKGKITAWCLAVPYLRYGSYPAAETYSKGVEKFIASLYENVPDKTLPVIGMAHLQASGAVVSKNDKSERIVIGGEEGISSDVFPDGLVYTALGHLHRAQHVPHRDNARYSGAPLPMSFAERTNKQGVVYVEIADDKTTIEKIELKPLISLQSIYADSVDELLLKLHHLPQGDKNETPYIELIVKITEPEPSLRNDVEEILQNKSVQLARLVCYTVKDETVERHFKDFDNISQIPDAFGMAVDIFKRKGFEMSENMSKLLKEVIRETEDCL
jgi:exonuclease SbcD